MSTLHASLGGQPVVIHWWPVGEHPDSAPPTGLCGLDVETTYMGPLGQWSPDFRVRLAQFATGGEAWVLNAGDAVQRETATRLLGNGQRSFASHSNMDVLSAYNGLGVDITGRNLDTLCLAQMAVTDKLANRDLKTLTSARIGPELAAAEEALFDRFAELWRLRREALAYNVDRALRANGLGELAEQWSERWADPKRAATPRGKIRKLEQPEIAAAWEAFAACKSNATKADVEAHGWATIPADDPAYVRYAGLDAVAAYRLARVLAAETRAPAVLLRSEVHLAAYANRIQLRGMRVDVDRLHAEKSQREAVAAASTALVEEITGGLSPRSPKLHEWFTGQGVEWASWPGALTEKGAPSLAKDNVRLLSGYDLTSDGRAVAGELATLQQHAYMLTKLGEIEQRMTPDGRVHPVLLTLGATTTARMAGRAPNFHNFSKRDPAMRGLFVPDDGMVLCTADFDQVELRVVAALAREEKMIDTILAGGDLHQLTVDELAAARVVIERDAAKITNFLIVYGGGARALHEQTGIPLAEAAQIISAWRDRYPAIAALAFYLGLQKEEIRTITGRRLAVTRDGDGRPRSYANINYAVQSAARDLLAQAWHVLERRRPGIVWLPIHDELVFQVPGGEVAGALADVEDSMRFDFRGVPISATAVELREADGMSRWMTAKRAEKIAAEVAA